MAKKGAMPIYPAIDDYINDQTEEAQATLNKLRDIIHQAVPDVIEVPNYKVPSFLLTPTSRSKQDIMMSATKQFISFSVFPSTLNHFKSELKEFSLGKGSIQIPFNAKIPESLFIQMIQFRKQELSK